MSAESEEPVRAIYIRPKPKPKWPYFGGKSPKPLPYHPMPYMEEFLDNLRADGRTPAYWENCKGALTHFALFAETEGIRHPDEITRQHVLRYQVYLTERKKENGDPLSKGYRQKLMKILCTWLNWLDEVGYIEKNPWYRIRIGIQTKTPRPLEDDEITALFATHRMSAFSMTPFFFHRREVILVLLLGWGLRIHELEALNQADLDVRSDWVTAINKGGSRKQLPFSQEMKAAVMRYFTVRARYGKVGEDALLITEDGRRLTIHAIRKIITELGRRANVDLNPHQLRDTFGTTMLDHDVPVERISKLMGHTNTSQTLKYARVNEPKLKESHDEVMNPLLNRLLGPHLPT